MRRILVDVSNLSIHSKKFVRTGIQEVVYQTLLGLIQIKGSFPDVDLILLPQLPRRFGNLLQSNTTVPYQNVPLFILEAIEEQFRLSSKDIWGIDLKAKNYQLSDEEAFQWIASAERLHIQGMVNVGPLMEALSVVQAPCANHLSMTLYDLAPILFPEYCDHGLARWFQETYISQIGRFVKNAVCISRHTAIDVMNFPLTQRIPQVTVLPLPGSLGKVGRDEVPSLPSASSEYLIFLGSLEPRKYFEAVLTGYETFRKLSPNSNTQLVLIGGTGWKNFHLENRIRNSVYAKDILRPGYLSDSELAQWMQKALALVMISQYEGYGLPLAQARSVGCPVITSLGSSLPEGCRGQGIFVEPHDPFSVCAGIQRARKEARTVLGKNRLPVEGAKSWTWQDYARELLGIIGAQDPAPHSRQKLVFPQSQAGLLRSTSQCSEAEYTNQ